MSELDVGAADDLDGLDDAVGVFLKAFLQGRIDGQHGRRAIGVPGVHTHGIHVFDKADRDHLVLGIAHDFQFQLLPAENRFLYQNLMHQTGRKARGWR